MLVLRGDVGAMDLWGGENGAVPSDFGRVYGLAGGFLSVPGDVPVPTRVFHITHLDNLPSILSEGGLWSSNEAARRDIKWHNIAYHHIHDRRGRKQVPLPPGGVLTDYVPWFFGPRPPMLLPLRDGLVEGYTGGQSPIVHLVTTVQAVARSGGPWMFTDVHAVLAYANFYHDAQKLDVIDWPLMTDKYWNQTPADPDRPARRQAELLVHRFVPWGLIEEIGVMRAATKTAVLETIGEDEGTPPVEVRNGWYY